MKSSQGESRLGVGCRRVKFTSELLRHQCAEQRDKYSEKVAEADGYGSGDVSTRAAAKTSLACKHGSPGGIRTPDTVVNSHLLYQLSYRGTVAAV